MSALEATMRLMRAYRSTQPYRRGARAPSAALTAMLAGKPAGLPNPMDVKRAQQLLAARRARRQR